MITKIFEIITKTGKAEKDIENLSSEVETLNTGLEKTNSEVGDLKSSGKAFATLKKGAKGVAGGFKMMGTALKAAGIGLALAAFGLLKQLFEENQKVVDTFNIAFEGLSIAFNDFFNFISSNIGAVTGFFKSIFDDPLGSIKSFGDAIYNGIIARIKQAIETVKLFGLTMAKLFEGDFTGALETAKKGIKSTVDIITGVDNTVEKVAETFKEGVKSITEYTKSTIATAKANIELKKTAELAAVANQGLIEKYDLLAESLRQIRDDERLSIAERKKANDELALVLDQQEKAMLSNAQISLRAARAELKKDKDNIEFKKAVMEAENELAAVRAQVAGFRSEQQSNDLALSKEELEMTNSKLESENKLAIERKRFDAEQIEDELEKLEKLKEIDAEEQEIETKRLQDVINTANAGTQAKIDAEIAYNEFLEQSRQKNLTRDKEISNQKLKNQKEELQTSEEYWDNFYEWQKDKAKADKQQKIDNQNAILDATSSALSSIGQIADAFAGDDEERARKAFNVNKGLGLAQAIIATSQGIMNAYTNPIDVASGVAFAKSIGIGLAGAAQIATIATTKFQPSGTGGSTAPSTSTGSGATTSPSQTPSFNVVGQSGFNQVAGALGQQQPVQAFVVSGDVTTAQQLQNNTITQATF